MNKIFADPNWILPLSIILLSIFPMWIFTTLVHEMGHAIAAYIYSKNRVVIYLGSYGDAKNSKQISLGRFDFLIKPNIFTWKGAMCSYLPEGITLKQSFIITLAGPIASLILALCVLAVILLKHPTGLWEPFFKIFCYWSLLVFLYNIFASPRAINLENGHTIDNDGAQMRKILHRINAPIELVDAENYFAEKKYKIALPILEKIIRDGTKSPDIYRMAITAHIKLKHYQEANQLQKQQINLIGNINTSDRTNMAILKCHIDGYDEGIKYCAHLLQLYGENITIYNIFGNALTETGRTEEALVYLDSALKVNPQFIEALITRAYTKIKLGMLEEANTDIEAAMAIDNTNPVVWRNSGLYNYHMWRYEQAIQCLEKALELDPETPLASQYIYESQKKMGERRVYK